MNKVRWRFDYYCNYFYRGSKVHGIDEFGRRFQCKHNGFCYCFSAIGGNGMACNSGMYKIKLKINKIYNGAWCNMVGLTSDKLTDGSVELGKDGKCRWLYNSSTYIAWSVNDRNDDVNLPHGLICGLGEHGMKSNIFRRSGFKYASRNGKYTSRLPGYESGDTIVMIYDSDLGQLSFKLFQKYKEESLLDSYIYNLPRGLTFYWFCDHDNGQMSVTIVD